MFQDYKIGLVLSGGGYRSAAHIGVLKAMSERGIKPNFISGSSAGAVIGAMYAAEYTWDDIYNFLKDTDVVSFRNYSFQKAGLLDSTNFVSLLNEVFPENSFEALKIPLFVATTDLLEARTRFYFDGELILPLIASSAIPGVFSPISFQNRLLCDGGVTNNLPTEPLIPLSDKIIGVYVNPLQKISKDELGSTRSVLERSYLIMRDAISRRNFNACDILIAPEKLSNFNVLSKSNLQEIFEMGYEEACIKLDALSKIDNA